MPWVIALILAERISVRSPPSILIILIPTSTIYPPFLQLQVHQVLREASERNNLPAGVVCHRVSLRPPHESLEASQR
jgi:hypothetical protein